MSELAVSPSTVEMNRARPEVSLLQKECQIFPPAASKVLGQGLAQSPAKHYKKETSKTAKLETFV